MVLKINRNLRVIVFFTFIWACQIIFCSQHVVAQLPSNFVNNGLSWLLSTQNEDGGWPSLADGPSNFLVTCHILEILHEFNLEDQSYYTRAVNWLHNQKINAIESLSTYIKILADNNISYVNPLEILLSNINEDNAWGRSKDYPSNVLDTAISLQALYYGKFDDINFINNIRSYLLSEQNIDGSWGLHKGGKASVYLTALVSLILTKYSPIISRIEEQAINNAKQWLINNQNVDGGWGKDETTIYDTTMAYKSLLWIGGMTSTIQSQVVNYLSREYNISGTWKNSPYLTGLAIKALNRVDKPDLVVTSFNIIPDNLNPIHGINVPLDIYIHNQGGTTAYNIRVDLYLNDPDVGGQLIENMTIDQISSGSKRKLRFTWNTKDIWEDYKLYVLIDPIDSVDESSENNNVAFVEGNILENSDLVIGRSNVSLTFFDSHQKIPIDNVYEGMVIDIRCTIENYGQKEAKDILVVAYNGEPFFGGNEISSSILSHIKGYSQETVYLRWDTSGYQGDYQIIVSIDPNNVISELNDDNNNTDLLLTVQEANIIRPSSTTGLTAQITKERTVQLTWNANPEDDIAGYNIYRRELYTGKPWIRLNLVEITQEGIPSASGSFNDDPDPENDNYSGPLHLIDQDYDTYWLSIKAPYSFWEFEPCFVQLDFPEPYPIQRVEIDWLDYDNAASWFEIQIWDGNDWQTQLEVQDNLDAFSICNLNQLVTTDKIRIHIVRGINVYFAGIRELRVFKANSADLVTGEFYEDTTIEVLPVEYAITAVDYAGNESLKSLSVELHDDIPPEINITSPHTGQRVGSAIDIHGTVKDMFLGCYWLQYGQGASPQEWIDVRKCRRPVEDDTIFVWNPPAGLDGIYTLRLLAIDMGGLGHTKQSIASVTVHIDSTPPKIPTGLTGELEGDIAYLSWDENQEPDFYRYIVYRNGKKLDQVDIARNGTASASSYFSDAYLQRLPYYAIDGSSNTFWRPEEGSYPYWWQVQLPEPAVLSKIILVWDTFVGESFLIQTWDVANGSWFSQADITQNKKTGNSIPLPVICQTDKVRIIIRKAVFSSNCAYICSRIREEDKDAPYPVLAEVGLYTLGDVQANFYRDADLTDSEYVYAVSAIDDLGNESEPSHALLLDKRSPRVKIYSPQENEVLGKSIVIVGKVEDRSLKRYTIEVGELDHSQTEPDNWEVIYTSLVQVNGNGPIGIWYPTDIEGHYLLRVRAEDYEGYTAMDQVKIEVDALPPSPPNNLQLHQETDYINIQWEAPVANLDGSVPLDDLAGYNIYRNDFILNMKDIASIASASAKSVFFSIGGLYDPYSVLDTCPHSYWLPDPYECPTWWQAVFRRQYSINKIAISWHNDDWMWARDYQIQTWDKDTEGWVTQIETKDNRSGYSIHSFSPTITDRVRIYITRGASSLFAGAISGINIYRADNIGIIGGTQYTDTEFLDIEGLYQVTALDNLGNESPKTTEILFDQIPPRVRITSPSAGALYITPNYRMAIYGTIEDNLLKERKLKIGKGENPTNWEILWHYIGRAEGQVLESSLLAYWNVPQGEEGIYIIQLEAIDQTGLLGVDRVKIEVDTKPPNQPKGLYGEKRENVIDLWWDPNPDPDLAGYNIYRNGKRINVENIAPTGEITASSSGWFPPLWPDKAADNDENTCWVSEMDNWPCWWRACFLSFYKIRGVRIKWFPELMGKDYLVQTWEGDEESGSWVTQKIISDLIQTDVLHEFNSPVITNKVRIYITRGLNTFSASIKEVEILLKVPYDLLKIAHFQDQGIYYPEFSYTVTAVDRTGNEGQPSELFSFDPNPPRLSITSPGNGEKVGRYIEIKGTIADKRLLHYVVDAGPGFDPSEWELIDDRISEVDRDVISIWEPPTGINDNYTLRIRIWDMAGNITEERIYLYVDTIPPTKPKGLSGLIQNEKAILDWLENTEVDLTGYNIYRNGKNINLADITLTGLPSASENNGYACLAVDGDYYTQWLGSTESWWQEEFESLFPVSKIIIDWGISPKNYYITLCNEEECYPYDFITDNTWGKRIHYISEPFRSLCNTVRITILPDSDNQTKGITEINIYQAGGGIVQNNHYEDQWVNEIGFVYQVSAVDDVGNESILSDEVFLDTEKPVADLNSPAPGEILNGLIDFSGTAWDLSMLYYRIEVGEGLNPYLMEEVAFSNKRVKNNLLGKWRPTNGIESDYTITLTVLDTAHNESIDQLYVFVDTKSPLPPNNIEGIPTEQGIHLTWQESPDKDVIGYNIYRNEYKISGYNLANLGEVSAYSSSGYPCSLMKYPTENANDGDLETFWAPEPGYIPVWLEMNLPDIYPVRGVNIHWLAEAYNYSGRDYWIQTWDGFDWINQVIVSANQSGDRNHLFEETIYTDRIRIYILSGNYNDYPGAIREVEILSSFQSGMIEGNTLEDKFFGDIEYLYKITAVDRAGNESQPSLVLDIDHTPPRVKIASPQEGDLVSGYVRVEGSVADKNLVYYILEYGEGQDPAKWHEFHRGNKTPSYKISVDWYPPKEKVGVFSLRLGGVDRAGQISYDTIWVNLDTKGPEAPQGLHAEIESDSIIRLNWTEGYDEDILGYYIYRDGQRLNNHNIILTGTSSASSSYNEKTLPWKATDSDCWTSWQSNSNLPSFWQVEFGSPVYVYKLYINWYSIGLLIDFGAKKYQIQSWDEETGEWITQINVKHRQSYIGSYTFKYPVMTTKIRVYMIEPGGPRFGISEISLYGTGLIISSEYKDIGLLSLEHSYQVSVVDRYGNEGPLSDTFEVDVHAPEVKIISPSNGALVGREVEIWGTVYDEKLLTWDLEYGKGVSPIEWMPIIIYDHRMKREELIKTWNPPEDGWMTLRLYAKDIFGHLNEDIITIRVDITKPNPPENLLASYTSEGIQINWDPSPDSDIAGYNLYKNGKQINILDITDQGKASASSERDAFYVDASKAIDDALDTSWQQSKNEYPCWWEIEFPSPRYIYKFILDWSDSKYIYYQEDVCWARKYEIKTWEGDDWVDHILVADNQLLHLEHTLETPVFTNKARLVVYESDQLIIHTLPINKAYIGLKEISIHRSGITGLIQNDSYLDKEIDKGGYRYTITSVDQAGNESFPSLPFSIGDCPPDVLIHSPSKNDLISSGIEIKGSVRDPALTVYKVLVGPGPNPWQWEQIGYGREEIENDILAIWEIPKGIEQTYTIKLTAINNLGIIGTESIPVIVDTIAPEAPRRLTCTKVQDSIGLSWEPNIEKDIAGYNIYRNGQLLNTIEIPYQDIVVTASNYLDYYFAYLPELAIDGQDDTGWMTDEYPCWIEFDLGLPYRIKGLEFISYDYFDYPQYPPKDYYIQTWDGLKYISQTAAIGNVQTFCRHIFNQPVITSKVRIYIEGNTSTPRTGIGEVTIYREGVSAPIPSQIYYDDEFLDLQNTEFIYNITAVDKLNNESIKSYQAIFDQSPPLVRIDHPQNNQWLGNQLYVTGAIEDSFLDEFIVEIGEGMDTGIWQIIHRGYTPPKNDTIMVWNIPQGMEGTYQIKVTAWDKNKNETFKTVSVNMDTKKPISPRGFTGHHNDDQIQFHWDSNPESDVDGYNLYRNEEKVNRSDVSDMASATASSFNPYGPPQNVLDDDDTTFWMPDTQDTYPVWLELGFPVAVRISALTLKWRQNEYGVNFNIQTWNNDTWENVLLVSDNDAVNNNFKLDPLLISNRIRIYIFSGVHFYNRSSLLEVNISQPGGLITANSFTEYGIVSGGFRYWVTAVDRAMNESPPSTTLSFDPISLEIDWEKKDYDWFDSITNFDNVFPVFADLDNDKDLDLIMGDYNGKIIYCTNVGTILNPSFSSKVTHIDYTTGINSHPSLGDMDDDGDLDMVVGTGSGLTFFRNIGTNQIPQWQEEEGYFSDINGGTHTIPDFVDFDCDQDLDLIIFASYEVDHGYYTSTEEFFKCFENKGSKENPVWEENTSYLATLPMDIPFLNSFDFVDLDHDGIIDPIYNNGDEYMQFFKNTGTENIPQWVAETSVFNNLEKYGTFALGDLDNDGDLDLLVAEYFIWDILHYYENRGDDDYGPQNASIQINQGQTSTLTPQVTLSLYAEEAVSVKISNYRDGAMGVWMDYKDQVEWTLPVKAPQGSIQRVYTQFKNATGHLSPTVSDEIICNLEGNPADVNGDTQVNIYDLVLVARRIGAKEGDQLYEPKYDLKYDKVINIFDLIIVARELE